MEMSQAKYTKKAPFNDWWYWSDVLSKRLRTIADIYKENDEKERSKETAATSKKLYDLFIGPARKGQKGTKTEEEAKALAAEEEAAIADAVVIWTELLTSLPFMSEQMEAYLNVKWQEIDPQPKKDKNGDKDKKDGSATGGSGAGSGGGAAPAKTKKIDARAVELFWGPKGRYDEGIRSGMAKDGGITGILMNYLRAEKTNSNRSPTEYKNMADITHHWRADQSFKPPGMGGM